MKRWNLLWAWSGLREWQFPVILVGSLIVYSHLIPWQALTVRSLLVYGAIYCTLQVLRCLKIDLAAKRTWEEKA